MKSVKEDLELLKEPVKFNDEEFKEPPAATVPKIEEVEQDVPHLNNVK
jgi:hypothetical protein